jgi:hypothetical protein
LWQPENTEEERKFDADDVRAFDPAGKRIPGKELVEVLKRKGPPAPVVVSADGKDIDPLYLSVLKEGTPVLLLPQPKSPVLPPPPAPGRH